MKLIKYMFTEIHKINQKHVLDLVHEVNTCYPEVQYEINLKYVVQKFMKLI
jgi:hypothetical protein